ncbi:MAG: CRISPR-associated endonuclease Cas2 [Nitrospirae bacterium CG02_land_8_20_14_3_00_44_33]|nr:MAG: CRISPR-associated endonuclease Cas2 [Nitrospirae bacterium CG02_land_8_20_14_3_00_44_33]PIW89159.1 MAG: CRISPR-associated endonuclease Cas2 [Nitrospirae bacterium CG_4_8_14_3_um_filter_44_28]
MEEHTIYIFYDIENDGIRNKIAEKCKDYGLERIQFSGFSGILNRNKREELFLKLSSLIGNKSGKVLMLPICERDMRLRKELMQEVADD